MRGRPDSGQFSKEQLLESLRKGREDACPLIYGRATGLALVIETVVWRVSCCLCLFRNCPLQALPTLTGHGSMVSAVVGECLPCAWLMPTP